jgi:hypothetical protein
MADATAYSLTSGGSKQRTPFARLARGKQATKQGASPGVAERACVRVRRRCADISYSVSFLFFRSRNCGRQKLKGFPVSPQKVLVLRLAAAGYGGAGSQLVRKFLRSGGGPTPKGGSPSPPSTSTRGFEVPHRQHFNAVPGYSWLCGMDHTRVMTTLLRGSGLSTHHGSV